MPSTVMAHHNGSVMLAIAVNKGFLPKQRVGLYILWYPFCVCVSRWEIPGEKALGKQDPVRNIKSQVKGSGWPQ